MVTRRSSTQPVRCRGCGTLIRSSATGVARDVPRPAAGPPAHGRGGLRAVEFGFPLILSGVADVREWWDDAAACFRIDVRVANKVFGPLFGYSGSFRVEERACSVDDIPADVLPCSRRTGSSTTDDRALRPRDPRETVTWRGEVFRLPFKMKSRVDGALGAEDDQWE